MIPLRGLGANMRKKSPLIITNVLGNISSNASLYHQKLKESHGVANKISFLIGRKGGREG